MSPRLETALSALLTVLTPVALILLGVRLLLTPLSPAVEYRMPGFPADPYGFTLADRLRWSDYSVRYLLNSAGIEFLGDLRLDDGSPLFTERELSHMHDVKRVAQAALTVLYVTFAVLAGLGVYAWFGGWKKSFLSGLRRGGWLTVGLILGLGTLAALSFWSFFSMFHAVFFQGDSWLFAYSDTLIRLFPIRFWQDVFIFVLGFALIAGLLLGLFAKPRRNSAEIGKV